MHKYFEFNHVVSLYQNKIILNDLSFKVNIGEMVAILGPNGAGKTSIINSIFGLLNIACGEILFDGINIKNINRKEFFHKISAVPQFANSKSNLKVKDFILLGDLDFITGDRLFNHFDKVINLLDLENLLSRKLVELSSGEFKRVLIAQSLIKNPDIIFLDEPLAHLDINYQFEILDILQNLNKAGKTIFVIIHDINLALKCFNRFIFLKNGKIIADIFKSKIDERNLQNIISQTFDIKEEKLSEIKRYVF